MAKTPYGPTVSRCGLFIICRKNSDDKSGLYHESGTKERFLLWKRTGAMRTKSLNSSQTRCHPFDGHYKAGAR
jgi:hypothetical protein